MTGNKGLFLRRFALGFSGRLRHQARSDFAVDIDQDVELFLLRVRHNVDLALEDEVRQVDDVAAQIFRPVSFGIFHRRIIEHLPDIAL